MLSGISLCRSSIVTERVSALSSPISLPVVSPAITAPTLPKRSLIPLILVAGTKVITVKPDSFSLVSCSFGISLSAKITSGLRAEIFSRSGFNLEPTVLTPEISS